MQPPLFAVACPCIPNVLIEARAVAVLECRCNRLRDFAGPRRRRLPAALEVRRRSELQSILLISEMLLQRALLGKEACR